MHFLLRGRAGTIALSHAFHCVHASRRGPAIHGFYTGIDITVINQGDAVITVAEIGNGGGAD